MEGERVEADDGYIRGGAGVCEVPSRLHKTRRGIGDEEES